MSLRLQGEYAFIEGDIVATDGAHVPAEDYRQVTNEYLVSHSSAKWTRNRRDSLMVGALARFNNNYSQLHPRAKAAATALGIQPKITNPYLNTAAQVVEIVHCVEDSIVV